MFDVQTSSNLDSDFGSDSMARAPGSVRDAIVRYMSSIKGDASVAQIRDAIALELGKVAPSSVRSYLNLNVPDTFERTGRGRYLLKKNAKRP